MMARVSTCLVLLLGGLLLVGAARAEPLAVVVSVPPQKTFVERIGGDRVRVLVMVPPGANPAIYEPTPGQMRALAEAELYFSIGVPFERAWLARFAAANPAMDILDMAEGLGRRSMAAHDHDGNHAHETEAGLKDPHLWVSPPHVRLMAVTIAEALAARDPEGAMLYRRNHLAFAAEIAALDAEIAGLLSELPAESRNFLVFHPSWGYFARVYGLTQIAVEAEGKEPGPRVLARLIGLARRNGIRTVFAQPEFSQKSAKAVAEAIGGRVVSLTPLAEDWAANLRHAARAIADAAR